MISFLMTIFFRQELKSKHFIVYLFYELVNVFLTFSLIYLAGKSLTFSSIQKANGANDYLHFLFFGEIALILPLGFGDKFINQYTNLKSNGFFQTILSFGHDPIWFIIKKSLVESYMLLVRVFALLIIGLYLLNFNFTFSQIFIFILTQFLGLVCFFIFAAIFIFIHWEFNRGLKLFYSLQTIFSVFSGQFFPRDVLPFELSNIIKFFPHSLILDQSRSLSFSSGNIMFLLGWTIFLGLSLYVFRKASIYRLKRKSVYF